MSNKREMPSSLEAEESVLGTIIMYPECFSEISHFLSESVFYEKRNQKLFSLIKRLIREEFEIDLVSICSNLSEDVKYSGLNASYIAEISERCSSTASVGLHSKLIYEKMLLRDVINHTSKISENAFSNNGVDVYGVMGDAHTTLGRLIDIKPGKGFDLDVLLDDTVESIVNSERNIVKTGFKEIDELSGGMTRGELSIVGGRPGHGKTTTMINMIKSCMEQGLKVIVFNREMTNVEMLKKILVLESRDLSYLNVRLGYVGDLAIMGEIERTKELLKEKYSPDKFAMFDNLTSFEESAIQVKKFKPDIIFDDYIQLITPSQKIDQRRLQLEKIVNDYKWLVKKENCVGVLMSQLNRGIESRGDNKPKLSDLAESGAIEQVAENVMFVYYKYKTDVKNLIDSKNIIELIASKVRYGNSGSVKLGFNGDRVKLYNSLQECRKEMVNVNRK